MKEKEVLKYCLEYLQVKGYFGQCNEFGGRVNTMGTSRIGANGKRFFTKNKNLYKGLPDIIFFCRYDPLGEKSGYYPIKEPPKGYEVNTENKKRNNPHIILMGIECKSDSGKQSEEQKKLQELWESIGGVYLIVRKSEEIEEVL